MASDDQNNNYDILASFTPAVSKCERSSCQQTLPTNQLKLVRSKHPSQADRLYCPSCFEHAKSKGGTIVRKATGQNSASLMTSAVPPMQAPNSTSNHPFQAGFISAGAPLSRIHIRQQVNAAQRNSMLII